MFINVKCWPQWMKIILLVFGGFLGVQWSQEVHRMLKRNHLYQYHVKRVQALLHTDYQRRIDICREMLRRFRQDPFFFNQSHVVMFKKDGSIQYAQFTPMGHRESRHNNGKEISTSIWSQFLCWYPGLQNCRSI